MGLATLAQPSRKSLGIDVALRQCKGAVRQKVGEHDEHTTRTVLQPNEFPAVVRNQGGQLQGPRVD